MNPLKRFAEFILNPSNRKTVATLVILIIAAAVPLTVLVAQQQQNIRQKAAFTLITCKTPSYTGVCKQTACSGDGSVVNTTCMAYSNGTQNYCCPATTPTPAVSPTPTPSCLPVPCCFFTVPPQCQLSTLEKYCPEPTIPPARCTGASPTATPVTSATPSPTCYPVSISSPPPCLYNGTCTVKQVGGVLYYCPNPTPTPTVLPTTTPSTSPTATPVVPNCNSGGVNTSSCTSTQANTCSNNGTQTHRYDTSSTGQKCNPVTSTITCSVNNCSSGNACVNGVCSGASATPSPTTSPSTSPTANPSASPSPSTSASPTPTPQPGDTVLALSVGMDGVGSTGTNQNPVPLANWKNNPPKTLVRNVTVDVWDSNNNKVINGKPGTVTYDSTNGYFTGTVNLGGSFVTGNYTVKVKSDGHLKRLVSGIQNITHGAVAQMPRVNLVVGDITGDNIIDIRDYNIFISCSVFSSSGVSYSPNSPFDSGALCNTAGANYQALSDLDDNGVIDQIDYNLFIGEYSIQNGD